MVQASFDIKIYEMLEKNPGSLLVGQHFRSCTGLQGVIESDFFTWYYEVGGVPLIKTIARRVTKFNWKNPPADIAVILYEAIIPPAERRALGEYYTPSWLAKCMVEELIDDPLNQSVLDPACGSGTFLAAAISHFIAAADRAQIPKGEVFSKLRTSITGIDVHPVVIHLARATWVLAARTPIEQDSYGGFPSIPVYLGDALQLQFRTEEFFAKHQVTIDTGDKKDSSLNFPRSLVDRTETFDSLMLDITKHIKKEEKLDIVFKDNDISDPTDREILRDTIETLRRFQRKGKNHIWSYYIRNLVRPFSFAKNKFDVVIGNPPWINYNKTYSILRDELSRQSKRIYDIWTGGRYATHQDVAGFFYTKSVDLYLKDDGVIGMVMPHSALQSGQYSKWRTGRWVGKSWERVCVDFSLMPAWDLESLKPNTFFPIPACVIFARRDRVSSTPLSEHITRWIGEPGTESVQRVPASITDTSRGLLSPYAKRFRQGASMVPRCLWLVNEIQSSVLVRASAASMVTVNPRRGGQDKEPWRSLDLEEIENQTVEANYVFNVYLGETIVPYGALAPLKAVLPIELNEQEDYHIPLETGSSTELDVKELSRRMRERWRAINRIWEKNKKPVNKLNLLGQLDYRRKLSAQLEEISNGMKKMSRGTRKVVYTSSGRPNAALLYEQITITESTLFWANCRNMHEANYLLAIINSDALYEAVKPFMSKGQWGARHLMKHLWMLAIPEFDRHDELHVRIAKAGRAASRGVSNRLKKLREEGATVTIARRELRNWLRESPQGQEVEEAVSQLLKSKSD